MRVLTKLSKLFLLCRGRCIRLCSWRFMFALFCFLR